MTDYVRILGRDVWHFHERCHHMKRIVRKLTDADWLGAKPKSGELCNECQAKARADKRTQARKRK